MSSDDTHSPPVLMTSLMRSVILQISVGVDHADVSRVQLAAAPELLGALGLVRDSPG